MLDVACLIALLESNPADPRLTSPLPFWDDAHISTGMLAAHLDPGTDAASRRPEQVHATLEWLTALVIPAGRSLDILDLGCGPGLYAQQLAARGHRVTGIDLSARSLEHARDAARAAGLELRYEQGSYLDLDAEAAFDLVLLIYCDFGALTRGDQRALLPRIRRALRPGGVFVFDVFGPDLPDSHPDHRTWSLHPQGGFWSPRAHLVLEERRHVPDERAVARRIILLAEGEDPVVHHLRDHYFGGDELVGMLRAAGFGEVSLDDRVLGQASDRPTVTFVTTRAPAAA